MSCSTCGIQKCFNKTAGRYARRFLRRGLDRSQTLLAQGLLRHGIEGKTILEVGCGVGALHLTLLGKGAARAFGVDVTPRMIEEAKGLASVMGVDERTDYAVGDIVALDGVLPLADIVLLDKVICCYPELGSLIRASAAKTVDLFAVSYPRAALLPRLSFSCAAWIGKVLRWSYRPFYHEPRVIEETISDQNFRELESATTPFWQIRIYRKGGGENRG